MTAPLEVKYQDKRFFPLFILFINIATIYLTYYEFLLTKKYLTTLLLDTIEVTCAWLAIRAIIVRLDKKLPYQQNFPLRLLVQLLLTTVVALLILIALTEVINWMLTSEPVPKEVYTHHIWIFAIWNLIINAIYIIMYFFKSSLDWQQRIKEAMKSQKAEARVMAEGNLPQNALVVKLGNKTKVMPFTEIAFCTTGVDFSVVGSNQQEMHLSEKSLEQLESLLPSSLFFRANRQYIIHRNLVGSIERIENGKLKVSLKPFNKLPTDIVISRTKAPSFKEWLKINAK